MKCIVHLDMDCFYAQVEAVRLGIDCRTVPFALVQWGSLVAVNYPARARGITRFDDTVEAALLKCPELITSHIATYHIGETEYGYPAAPNLSTHKVALEPYRDASRRIFDVLRSVDGVVVGKAGIDEAFLDVTEAARDELVALRRAAAEAGMPLADALRDVLEPSTKLIADRTEAMRAWFAERGTSLEAVYDAPMRTLSSSSRHGGGDGGDDDVDEDTLLLCAASRVVWRVRERVYRELHYDCSAGIAHNKMLAKCISATHKPNQQTLLLPARTASALFDLPLSRLRGFGGKFGTELRERVCGGGELCRDAWLAPLSSFQRLSNSSAVEVSEAGAPSLALDVVSFSEPPSVEESGHAEEALSSAAGDAFYRVRGWSSDVVEDPATPRTYEASKIFHPWCISLHAAREWMKPIAGELLCRFWANQGRYNPKGRVLNVVVRAATGGGRVQRRQVPLPLELEVAQVAALGCAEVDKLLREINSPAGDGPSLLAAERTAPPVVTDRIAPLKWVALTITGLRPSEAPVTAGQRTLTNWFSAKASEQKAIKRSRSMEQTSCSDAGNSADVPASVVEKDHDSLRASRTSAAAKRKLTLDSFIRRPPAQSSRPVKVTPVEEAKRAVRSASPSDVVTISSGSNTQIDE